MNSKNYRNIPIRRHIKHSSESEDHKYVARVETGNPKYKYRYFYTNPAYQAYLNGLKKTSEPVINKPVETNHISNLASSVGNAVKNTIDDVNRYIFKGEQAVASTINNDVRYEDVDKEVNYTVNAKNLTKSLVSNVLRGFAGMDMKVYDKVDSFEELPKKTEEYTDKEDQAVINPDYDPETYAYSMNCAYCTAAYELRQRGYDVEAAPVNVFTANTMEEIASWYEDAEPKSFSTVDSDTYNDLKNTGDVDIYEVYAQAEKAAADKMVDELKQYGDGARGQFCLYWYGGGGHSMIWEVENNDVVVRDAQTNEIVDMTEYFGYATDGFYIRTDNLELSDEILKTVRQRF